MIGAIFMGLSIFVILMTLNDIKKQAKNLYEGAVVTGILVSLAYYFS